MRTTLMASTLFALFSTTAGCSDDPAAMLEPQPQPEAPQPAIALQLPASTARVIRNQAIEVAVTVTRNETATGPITVTAEDLPAGLSAAPVTLAAEQTQAVLSIVAGADIALGTEVTATIRATAGELDDAKPVDLRLTDKPGALDVTFGVSGKQLGSFIAATDEQATAVAVQSDGKLVVGGRDSTNKNYFVARYGSDGLLDSGFANGGLLTIPTGGVSLGRTSIAVRADGSILFAVAVGTSTIVYALDSTGALLTGYGNSGAAVLSAGTTGGDLAFASMATAADGSAVIAGYRGDNMGVVRLTSAGQLDVTFDGDGVADVDFGGFDHPFAIGLTATGGIVVAGNSVTAHFRQAVARLTASGQLDSSFSMDGLAVFDTGVGSGFEAMRVLADGRVALAAFNTGTTYSAVMLDADGSHDLGFDGDGIVSLPIYVTSIDESEGGVVLSGYSLAASAMAVVKLSMTGALDPDFGTEGVATADMVAAGSEFGRASATDEQGRLIVVGSATMGAELGQLALARMWR